MIPVSNVTVSAEARELVTQVLDSGHLASGPMVERLETEFAAVTGTRHAVAVSSGTAALVAALHASGIGPGDEVITSPFTFVATVNSIIASGATVTFVDVDDDLNLDAERLEAALTDRTRAVIPVHLYGQPAEMGTVCRLAARRGLTIIEDAAQAVGASYRSQPVGSFGVGCFSLYATKNITTGEGGIVTTDDATVADKVRLFRNQGMRQRYQYESVGFNHRLTDLQAALGIPQLAEMHAANAKRAANAARMSEAFTGLKGVTVPRIHHDRRHVFHQYTLEITADAALSRDDALDRLGDLGVQAAAYYPKLAFDHPPFMNHPQVVASDVPRAQRATEQVLSLPVRPDLTDAEVAQVIAAVCEVMS